MRDRPKHVVFFSFPGLGHLRPVLPPARILAGRGHRVTAVVPARLADVAAGSGATAVPYESGFPVAPPAPRTPQQLAALVAEFQREALAALPAVWDRLAGEPVDLVVEDALSTVTAGLVADRAGCPTVRTFPGLAGNDEVPLNGAEPEPGDPQLRADAPELHRAAEQARATLDAHGLTPADVDRVLLRQPVANLVFVPRAFQPHADRFDDSFAFVGPEHPDPPPAGWRPPAGRRVALVSLGTSAPRNPGFFVECARAFAGSGWYLVMTTGGHLDAGTGRQLGPDVELHDWLDHDLVLPHADVLVCPAGAGSLMQAFAHGVPVVAVPQKPDARPVARHVAALGLGRSLFGELSGRAVRDTAVAVADDAAAAAAARRMAAAIRAAGGARRAADIIEAIARRSGEDHPPTAA